MEPQKSEQAGPWRDAGVYCREFRNCGEFQVEQFIRDRSCYLKLVCGGELSKCLCIKMHNGQLSRCGDE